MCVCVCVGVCVKNIFGVQKLMKALQRPKVLFMVGVKTESKKKKRKES